MKKTKCANCGKVMFTHLKNRMGDFDLVFCDKLCESEYKNPHLKERYGRKHTGHKGA